MSSETHNPNGKFKKGHGGLKPKGAKSRALRDLEEAKDFLGKLMYVDDPELAKEDWKALSPALRYKYRGSFGEFYWPKLARNENVNTGDVTVKHRIEDLVDLPTEELNRKLKEKLESSR